MVKLRANCLLRGRCYRIIYVVQHLPLAVFRSRPRAVKRRAEATLRPPVMQPIVPANSCRTCDYSLLLQTPRALQAFLVIFFCYYPFLNSSFNLEPFNFAFLSTLISYILKVILIIPKPQIQGTDWVISFMGFKFCVGSN